MLVLHRAERADRLVEALAAILTTAPDDPFTPEIVSVPSRGIERWLTQQLSNVLGASGTGEGDGICANLQFPFPGRLVGGALHAVTGVDPTEDPWVPARAAWPLMSVIDDHLGEGWMATLATHLGVPGDEARQARRFSTARHVADLFDRYSVHRPGMITSWARGDDVDGRGDPLRPDMVWQALLWRLLRDRIGVPSPAERLGPATERLREAPDLVELPDRVSLFGLTRLAPSMLQTLDAIAVARDVHLLLLHPSPALWDRVMTQPGVTADAESPLLRSWGKDAREMQLAIAASVGGHESVHHGRESTTDTLLHRLQAGIHADLRPPGRPPADGTDARTVLRADDNSVQVHSCHGRARQVEVVRDAILHLLADEPTLEPRDVIVMCPDIETFAPLVHAIFGTGEDVAEDGVTPPGVPSLRVRLADRAVRQTNPVLGALAELLALASARVTASELVDFAGLEPVRRRFHFDDDDLARIEEWVSATGVRWGLDAAHRAPFQLAALGANTWRAGLDRLLLGVSMTEDDRPLVGGVLPLDDIDSGDISLAGRLAELVDRLHHAIDALTPPQTMRSWAAAIAAATDALTACSPRDAWPRHELDRLLQEVVAESSIAGAEEPELSLPELQSLLADRLRGRPSRVNFRTGHLTVCTLVPMRSVPHRVVCLLGLDDGSFPRHGAPDGDDIIERSPVVGDHDIRSEDRQLLLDALLAAGDHFVVTYSGRDERTNASRPPCVPIGELLDVIDASARAVDGTARGQVVTEHPLQAFDARNFEPGRLVPGTPWSFDVAARDGARARGSPRTGRPSFSTTVLPRSDAPVVELDDLVQFVQHPTKAFLRQRLGISLRDVDDELDGAIPIELDSLGSWGVGDRLLAARLAGAGWTAALDAERARGLLPPGLLGERVLADVRPTVEAIHAATLAEIGTAGEARSVDVSVDLGVAGVLVGTVAGVRGQTLVNATYSRVAAKHRIASWARLLALCATEGRGQPRAVTVGRPRRGRGAGVARIPSVPRDISVLHLGSLLDLYTRGMREPLPIYCNTSEALARRGPARSEWVTESGGYDKEDRDRDHVFVLGERVPFAQLLAEQSRPDEDGPGWASDEPTRTGRYAMRLWGDLLAVEEREEL